MEESGKSHGVFLKNSNAMGECIAIPRLICSIELTKYSYLFIEVILQPTPALTFRSLGGVFDFYFFLGPSPDKVIEQYSEVIGKPFLPPYWSLGYHQCKFGYGSVNRTKAVMERTIAAKIPFDVQWNDIDYMDRRNDFTLDRKNFGEIKSFVDDLHKVSSWLP